MSSVSEAEEKLFHAFLLNVSKIMSGYTVLQRTLASLSKRDEHFITEYKDFISASRSYNKRFFAPMFTQWIQSIVDVNLIFEPIEYRLIDRSDRTNGRANERDEKIVCIRLDIIQEWGLRIDDKKFIRNLEIIILRMIVLYHDNEQTVSEAKDRLNELQPPQIGPAAGIIGSDGRPNMQNIGGLVTPIFKTIVSNLRNNPDMKDQIPSDEQIDSMVSKITNMDAIGDITSSIQDGSIMTKGSDIVTKLMQDKELQSMFQEIDNPQGSSSSQLQSTTQVKTFADIPPSIMPPGEAINPNAPIPKPQPLITPEPELE